MGAEARDFRAEAITLVAKETGCDASASLAAGFYWGTVLSAHKAESEE